MKRVLLLLICMIASADIMFGVEYLNFDKSRYIYSSNVARTTESGGKTYFKLYIYDIESGIGYKGDTATRKLDSIEKVTFLPTEAAIYIEGKSKGKNDSIKAKLIKIEKKR